MAGAITITVAERGVGAACGDGARPRSVREVCLISGAPGSWEAGDLVRWSGRVYRVESTTGSRAEAGYVHLAPGGAG
jgi:hypothetical protein